jgi:hypothetical protein
MNADAFSALALSLPETAPSSHMGASDFRVGGKIFAQPPGAVGGHALVKLTPEQQDLMCGAEPTVFTPEPGYWGRAGWTRVTLAALDETTAKSVLWTAWRNVAPKRLAQAHGP